MQREGRTATQLGDSRQAESDTEFRQALERDLPAEREREREVPGEWDLPGRDVAFGEREFSRVVPTDRDLPADRNLLTERGLPAERDRLEQGRW